MIRANNIRAKKHFGQNFLQNPFTLDRILQASAELLEGHKLIEIGVGLGDLSERLLSLSSLTTYEIDADLCSFVLQKFSSRTFAHAFSLVHRDVLAIPFGLDSTQGWLANEPYILVSNLPYNIATRVVLNLLHDRFCEGFVVMTQKEVARKFCADSGDSDFCALSVLAQSAGEIELLFDVGREEFEPMPKVTSSVFRMRKSPLAHLESGLNTLLKSAFSAPRKKLYTNLLPLFQKWDKKDALDRVFAQEQLPSNARPHEISTQKYHHIYNTLKDHL